MGTLPKSAKIRIMNDEAGRTRRKALFLIDGQNLFKSLKERFAYDRWQTDPLKLCQLVAERYGLEIAAVRFYTGIPRWDRHREMREFWERKRNDFASDDVVPCFKELRYNGVADRSGREKGVDVGLALDAFEAAVLGEVEAVVIFSQDNDLHEVPARAEAYLASEAARSMTVARKVTFFSAFPYDADQHEAFRRGQAQPTNFVGITGGKFTWIRLQRVDFEASVDVREAALAQAKINLPSEIALISQRLRKPAQDFEVATNGGMLEGKLVRVIRLPARAVLIFEHKADLLLVRASLDCVDVIEQTMGQEVRVSLRPDLGADFLEVVE